MSGAVFDLGCTVAERAICMTSWVSLLTQGTYKIQFILSITSLSPDTVYVHEFCVVLANSHPDVALDARPSAQLLAV